MEKLEIEFDLLNSEIELDKTKIQQWKDIGASLGKADIMSEIKAAYVVSNTSLIVEIKQLALEKNSVELKKRFHMMKSGCGNLGFKRLQKMCEFTESFLGGQSEFSQEEMNCISMTIEREFLNTIQLLESL